MARTSAAKIKIVVRGAYANAVLGIRSRTRGCSLEPPSVIIEEQGGVNGKKRLTSAKEPRLS